MSIYAVFQALTWVYMPCNVNICRVAGSDVGVHAGVMSIYAVFQALTWVYMPCNVNICRVSGSDVGVHAGELYSGEAGGHLALESLPAALPHLTHHHGNTLSVDTTLTVTVFLDTNFILLLSWIGS